MKKFRIIKTDGNDNSKAQAIYLAGPNRLRIIIARDSAGTQICREGCFFPDTRDFGSIGAAKRYLELHEDEAIKFFRSAKSTVRENLSFVLSALFKCCF